MVDVEATLKCFIELIKNETIKLNKPKDELMSLF
jgi:hypothetical protein